MSSHNTYADMNGQLDNFIDETVSKQLADEEFDYAATFWVTRTGREIPIRQMEDQHLKNAHAYVLSRSGVKARRFPKATRDALETEMARRGFLLSNLEEKK